MESLLSMIQYQYYDHIFSSLMVANVNQSIMFTAETALISSPLWLSTRQSLAPEIASPVYDSWFELSEMHDEKDTNKGLISHV